MNVGNLLKITQEKVNLDPGLISRGCFIFNVTGEFSQKYKSDLT